MWKKRFVDLDEALDKLIVTTGRAFFVLNPLDPGYSDFAGKNSQYLDGTLKIYSDVASGYNAMVSNRGDILFIGANTEHALTSMLDVSKNRVHFKGLDVRDEADGMGARTKISLTVAAGATNIATMKNTGVGNTFDGIKFINSSTVDEGLYAVAEGGEYTVYKRCEFYKDTDLDVDGAAEVLNNGDSVQWIDCTFGSTANTIATGIIRPCMLLTATLAGKKCRDNVVRNCKFLRKCDGTANRFIYGANATDVERMFSIENCLFFNNPLSAQTPAAAVDFGSAQTEGAVIIDALTRSVDVTVLGVTGKGIYTMAPSSPTYATSGKGVAS